MTKPKFVYVTYIATTPAKLWAALTGSEFTAQYWFGIRIETDWKVGSKLLARLPDGEAAFTGKVLENDYPRKLVHTFHAEHKGMEHEAASTATYLLEPVGEQVQLTILHEDFAPDSVVFGNISIGWPKILSSLKTLLETGHALPATAGCNAKKEIEDAVNRATLRS